MAEEIEKKNKKYVWLKLKQDFFYDPKIKKLRKIAGGDTYLCIYLKMMLWSLKNEGYIYFEGVETTFEDELSLIFDEDVNNIKILIAFLYAQNLLESSGNGECFLNDVPCLIGKEGESAERMRRRRKNLKNQTIIKASQCANMVTLSDGDVTQRREELKLKEDTHIDESFNSIAKFSNCEIEEYLNYKSKDARDKSAYKVTMRKALDNNNIDVLDSIVEYFRLKRENEVLIDSITNQKILFNNYNCQILRLVVDSPSFYFLHLKNLDTDQIFCTSQSMTIEQIRHKYLQNEKSLS